MRIRRLTPAIMGGAGLALLVLGAARIPGALTEIPGNTAAEALFEGRFVNAESLSLVLETRTKSISYRPTPDGWFDVGRAAMAADDPARAVRAFENGLLLAPASGLVWAEYARALSAVGRKARAREAKAHSVKRAPHDPRARRVRRH
jgi:predicted Zn-dependent protease